MSNDTPTAPSCLGKFSELSRFNGLGSAISSAVSSPTNLVAQISAAGLVLASAGFGCFFAWTTGTQHGYVLASLMVLMAAALELAKPLAIAKAFEAFRSVAIFRGLALTAFGVVAVTYSLTSELSLVAMSRGDLIASREASINADSTAEADRKRSLARYEAATRELATLPISRPSNEVQAEIDGLLLTPGADSCVAINGKVTREICPKVSELRKELARAERRSELEAVVATPLPSPKPAQAQAVKEADPGAKALATYLALLGIVVAPAVLSEWLILVPVLALEIGSAFAGILVQSVTGPRLVQASANRKQDAVQEASHQGAVLVVQAREITAPEDQPAAREEVKRKIVGQLKANGGSKVSSERGLAKLIGTSKPTVRRALQSLVMAGVIAAEATRNGTMLRLVA